MSGEITIGADDRAAAEEIMARAYERLAAMPLLKLAVPGDKTPPVIHRSRVCHEASDAVTRVAHELGIVASMEAHSRQNHHLTSFGPLDRLPADDDPVICLTLGQFQPLGHTGPGFFGPRRELARHFPFGPHYDKAFGSGSVIFRQVTHASYPPGVDPRFTHRWLTTTPEDVAAMAYPMGEVSPSAFEDLQDALLYHRH